MKIRPLYILLIVAVLLGAWLWSGYNGFIASRESVNAAWSQIQTQEQRRFDLIPNVEETVRGAAGFEQQTFTEIAQARSAWQSAGTREGQIGAARSFDSALARLLVTVENYPQLTATKQFSDLITELEGTENRIAVARRDYNEAVRAYNVGVMRFPSNILAGLFGFDAQPMFEAVPGAADAPKVNFGIPLPTSASSASR